MKNLLTYISPTHSFNTEHSMAAKIQVDNSLALGWNPGDILLATNFPYEYNGIKAVVINDDNYCTHHWTATKINAIIHLLQAGVITEVAWYHDFDCFQLAPIANPLEPHADLGLARYGRMPRLCSASMFLRPTALDILAQVKAIVDSRKLEEERALMRLVYNAPPELAARIKILNTTYAFHKFNLQHCYAEAEKPIKAAHFHLTPDKYEFYVRGNNKLGVPLIPERLVEVFHNHGWTN